MGAGILCVGRIACEPIHSHLLCAPAKKTVNDAQMLALNMILDKSLTSLDFVTCL